MVDTKIIGARIKELRQQHGLTQGQFADILSVSFQAVSNWERGIAPPDLENLLQIADHFGVLVDDLLRPRNDRLFLGIDGGGTKTEFAVITSDGHVLGELFLEGCNPNDIGFQKTVDILCKGIRKMLLEFPTVKAIFCGIAGITAGDYRKRLQSELKKYFPLIAFEIKNDSYNLFALNDNAQMSVISGTGSVVFVRNGDSLIRMGGWGYLLDNAGSAYDIGRAAIRQCLEEEDMSHNHQPCWWLEKAPLGHVTG